MGVETLLLATVVSAACPEKGLVFMGDETPRFAVSAVPADGTSWTVTDWRGETRADGRIAADGTLEVKGLPPGYWTLAVGDAAALRFTTVVDPATSRSRSRAHPRTSTSSASAGIRSEKPSRSSSEMWYFIANKGEQRTLSCFS